MAFWDGFDLWGKDPKYVRDSFIALWTLWIVWGLLQLAKYLFAWNDRHLMETPATGPAMRERVNSTESTHPAVESQTAPPATATTAATTAAPANTTTLTRLGASVARAETLARNLFITFLWVLVASTLGYGITRGSMIVAWLYFAFAIVWIGVEFAVSHPISRAGFGVVEFAFALAIMGIAFKFGW
ncbi:hypothetical protein K493DRAFT_309956 [Basidiobolus meristosporus CBS 931.73]|uniref:Uncharacterized protein n=1 Tax=Basidiobolus meristosporus CBS 931.73 TaxID=1314790 RepID=A0A1Y1ZD00_9FUNG|nr:hypothetical protein K493DRAFT_309956 [Basidiobolus meristosporus CBS 931.73]|eukprot:ORY08163.1 hypothetical protein K493DRAFT_309956 [Basidiobolus meristosporus CBS 931.73]